MHFLYQFSLQFFLDIFNTVLHSPKLDATKDYAARLSIIFTDLFQVRKADANLQQ